MSIQARNLIDAALKADLPKNSSKVFLAIFSKTVGYGKRKDYMTKGQLAGLTGIRKDRLDAALQTLIDLGLFEVKHYEHSYRFVIPDCFLLTGEDRFFSPSIPANGETTHKTGDLPEKRVHTDTTNTEIDLTQTNNNVDVSVCAVVPSAGEEIKKPDALNQQAYLELLPALKKLPNQQAINVLALLSIAILDGSIKTTQQRLGGALIKAAKAGTLDISALQCPEKPSDTSSLVHNPKPQPDSLAPRLNDLRSKILGLESLKKLAGELDPRSMAQLQAYQIELSQLKGGIA